MIQAQQEQLSSILEKAADALDIPFPLHEKAVSKYQEVGRWLEAPDSSLREYDPEVFPQGSFLLGTVTRPLSERDEYDIDSVSRLLIGKSNVTQAELKAMVGSRLRQHPVYREILEEKRRCWTLHFEEGFHLDVLPAIPNLEDVPESILITDTRLRLWQHSNPKGFAAWFRRRMEAVFEKQLRALAASLRLSIEEVPEWRVKTALQRANQILKRHRDIHFQNDSDDKPVSIIITTLAARAYRGETDLWSALVSVVRDMPEFIEVRNGVHWVPNPVNDKENFADRWAEHPERHEKFMAWLAQAEKDLASLLGKRGLAEVADALRRSLGRSPVDKAFATVGSDLRRDREAGNLRMATGTGILSSTGETAVRNHTFFGETDENSTR
jgi:hypothetical protein